MPLWQKAGLFLLPLLMTGCSTISSTVDSVGDSVNGWMGNDKELRAPVELEVLTPEFEPVIQWKHEVGEGTDGLWIELSHQVVDGVAYAVSADGVVVAVQASSGSALWRQQLDQQLMAGVAVGGESLYVATASGELIAFNRSNGTQRWSSALLSEVLSAPAATDGMVVVRTVDGKLIGLKEEDGEELWRYQREVPALTLRGTSRPVIDGDRVYAALDSGEVVVLSLQEGREIWMKSVLAPRGRTEIERMVDLDADPVVADGVLYVIGYQGGMAALNTEQGDLLWKRKVNSLMAPLVYGDYLFLADGEGILWAFDRKDGSALWKQSAFQYHSLTSPTLIGKNLVVGNGEGALHWVSAEDGHRVAQIKLGAEGIAAQPLPVGEKQIISYGKGGVLSLLAGQ